MSTDNLVGKLALTCMLEYYLRLGMRHVEQRILALSRYFTDALEARGVPVRSSVQPAHRSGIVNFLPGGPPEAFVARAESHGIYVGKRGGGVRASIHFYNTREDLDRVLALL